MGAIARTDEFGVVGGGLADGSGDSAGPALRRGRHAWSAIIRVPYTLPDDQLTEAVELLARAWRGVTGAAGPEPFAVVV